MKKMISVMLLLLSGVSYAGDSLQDKLAAIPFPGDASIQWNVPTTADFSTGKEKRDTRPASLASALKKIGKMNGDMARCDEAIAAFIELSNKYSDKSAVYAQIPICRVNRWMLHGIVDIMMALSDGRKIEILGRDLDATRELFNRGEKYFLGGMMADEGDPQFWKDALQFYFDRAWLDYITGIVENIVKAANAPKSGADKAVDDYFKNFLLNFEKKFASGPRMDIARHIIELDPKDTRYRAILGSLLTGKAYTKVVSDFMEALQKRNVGLSHLVDVIHSLRNDKDFSAGLDEAIGLIGGYEYLDSNARAMCDLGLAYLFREDFESAMGRLYRAAWLSPGDLASVSNLVAALVLRGWADFATDEQRAAGRKLAGVLEERLSRLKEKKPYDYLIAAKIFYKLGDMDKAAGLLDKGSAVYPDDDQLKFARALVYARSGKGDLAKEILKALLGEKDVDDGIRSNAASLAGML